MVITIRAPCVSFNTCMTRIAACTHGRVFQSCVSAFESFLANSLRLLSIAAVSLGNGRLGGSLHRFSSRLVSSREYTRATSLSLSSKSGIADAYAIGKVERYDGVKCGRIPRGNEC